MTDAISPQYVHTPEYVHDLIDALVDRARLDFKGHEVPPAVRWRVTYRRTRSEARAQMPPTRAAALTGREMAVLQGMAAGLSNKRIGAALSITEDTVKTHARRLFRKIQARDRAHAVAIAFRTGVLS